MPGDDLDHLTVRTIAHYDVSAESFREGTRDHDVAQNRAAFLAPIEGEPPFTILDFGCGPGRDLLYFLELGHTAVGLAGFEEIEHYYRPPGRPRHEQPWLATVWRRVG